MKLTFSTREVKRPSFLDICNFAFDYGFTGLEIYDPYNEKREHSDSIFVRTTASNAKRWLRNRSVSIEAGFYPYAIDSDKATSETVIKYIDYVSSCGIENLILFFDKTASGEDIINKLTPAVKSAEKNNVKLLFETVGPLSKTSTAVELITKFSSTALGVSWNVRSTFFDGGESAETTIKTLGAYINYVRIGDRKDGVDVLIGDGDLPVEKFVTALRSLNYDGAICVDSNDEISDPDIFLTHFNGYMSGVCGDNKKDVTKYYNRDKTGTFPYQKYEILNMTLGTLLDNISSIYPDQYAFRYTTLDYIRTYSEFRRDVDEAAAALIAAGVKPGYHVAVWATNIPQWYIAFWATVRIGAVLVTVNTAYKINEIEYLLRQSDTHTLVMIEKCKDINYGEIIAELCPELENNAEGKPLYAKNLPFLRNVVTVGFSMNGCLTWDSFIEKGRQVPLDEVKHLSACVKPEDVCNMQYTSGTTGFPKGVMLTHSNILNNGKIIGDRMDLSTADRMMIQVPMFHCFGMVLSMLSTMTHGGTVCPLPYFSPKSSLACISQERITAFNGVPTMFIAMFNHEDFAKTDFSHIRTGIMAGSNCPAELMKRAADEMNMKEIISVYGQTEAAPGCTMGEVNEDIEHRTETVGSAFPGVECRIINPETGETLPDGENGEFVARGFNIMKGYYKMPEATAQTIDADGWLHSGDICCRTPDGYYKVTGRLKDMIIRGGENIYPREIEEFYLTNPKVKDVQVIGVPDERYGEEVCAWIILHENVSSDIDEMKKYGNERIARHKVPRYFVFTKDFPMNAAGKILKYKMKEDTVEMLNSGKLK